jgi:hypothetical protein
MTVSEMPQREREIDEQWRLAAERWVELNARAELLEDLKSARFSELMQDQFEADAKIAVNRAEIAVKASDEYRQYIEGMVEARRLANQAKADRDELKMRFDKWQTRNAMRRTERYLARG